MKHYIKTLIMFSVVLILICLPKNSLGQTATQTNDLYFSFDPQNISANSLITVTLNSYSIDLDTPTISWEYNGKTVQSGIGLKTLSIQTGASGSSSTLRVYVFSGVNTTYTTSTTIQPADVDLLWQSLDSYAPPFYKGKHLPSDEGTLEVVAIGGTTSPKLTSYKWSRNDSLVSKASGAGKNAYTFTHDELNTNEDITVSIYNGGNNQILQGETVITPTTPSIVSYAENSGFVDYANGFSKDFYLSDSGATIKIEPYFFSILNNIGSDLSINLTLDGQTPDTLSATEVPIIKPDSSGTTTLTADIESNIKSWQSATQNLTIHF